MMAVDESVVGGSYEFVAVAVEAMLVEDGQS